MRPACADCKACHPYLAVVYAPPRGGDQGPEIRAALLDGVNLGVGVGRNASRTVDVLRVHVLEGAGGAVGGLRPLARSHALLRHGVGCPMCIDFF